jgi:N-acetylmuramoyl-L-alanine amidase
MMNLLARIIAFFRGAKAVSESAPQAAPPADPWPPSDPATVLAATAWMEARSVGKDGMQAVMSVVLNRARSGITWWGHDIVSVCLKRFQFSSWNLGSTQIPLVKAAMNYGDPQWEIARNLATLAVQGILPDNTLNSDDYFDVSIEAPGYDKPENFTVAIGTLRFYRDYLKAPGSEIEADA